MKSPETKNEDLPEIARCWDAGEIGCGALMMGLKREMGMIEAGERLHVTANNLGASADFPAWSRMTGHMLVSADHPTYVFRKKGDRSDHE